MTVGVVVEVVPVGAQDPAEPVGRIAQLDLHRPRRPRRAPRQ